MKSLFPLVKEAIKTVIPVSKLKYIAFSHFEADECGAMNDFLKEAPDAVAVCSAIGKMVTVDDQIIRPARGLNDNERLSLGKREIQWLYTPHVPHGWDCSFIFETSGKILFAGDLLTQVGNVRPALVENATDQILGDNLFPLDYYSKSANTQEVLKRLADLNPDYVCCMHGSSFKGDGKKLITGLSELF
eukprot:TRINITY_DN2019_c1_g1_i1.p1 TRINITY_DN2019_c1_g1~~TRINITY_DN2019_c1_g1_i1.p1  ORF type:complete len:189 (-),score=35.67 TRINITY_DN2019_c1_g1_i1:43-609(-)